MQWLRVRDPSAGGPGLTLFRELDPTAGTKSLHVAINNPKCCNEDRKAHVLQRRPGQPKK